MDLENQKRVKDFAEQYGPENVVVVLGAAEGEAAGLAAETVTAGDPTFAGPLAGVQLGLTVYHICEDEIPVTRCRGAVRRPIFLKLRGVFHERVSST